VQQPVVLNTTNILRTTFLSFVLLTLIAVINLVSIPRSYTIYAYHLLSPRSPSSWILILSLLPSHPAMSKPQSRLVHRISFQLNPTRNPQNRSLYLLRSVLCSLPHEQNLIESDFSLSPFSPTFSFTHNHRSQIQVKHECHRYGYLVRLISKCPSFCSQSLYISAQILELDEDDDHEFSRGMVWAYFNQASATFLNMNKALYVPLHAR
jgi:hypothetical protein